MHFTALSLIWLMPLLPVLAGLAAPLLPASVAARFSGITAALALLCALLSLPALANGSNQVWLLPDTLLVLRWDLVAGTMAVLVSFLGLIIMRFSRRYLDGDPGQNRFYVWLNCTLASVLLLVLAGHVLLLLAAWISTSLCLHRLLLFYPQRPGARFAARKKFVVSRIGDAALLTAAILLYRHYGTLEFDALFAQVRLDPSGPLTAISALLAICAMCKSAQLPFHSWLPDTMDTPTPVSALMHAGIINGGGFLLVRFSPVLIHAPGVMGALAIVGALTAAFGAVVMLTQPAVKRSLAYSTIAQMGFMILQCGLGAFGLALIHIVAHSLYKAYAFLTAGSTIGAVPRAVIPLRTTAIGSGLGYSFLMVAGGMFGMQLLGGAGHATPGVFILITALAIAYGLARTWSARSGVLRTWHSLGLSAVVIVLSFAAHELSALLIPLPTGASVPWALQLILYLIFSGLFLLQLLLWRAHELPLGRRLYVHALNGFYLGTLANRMLGQLWPSQPKST
jgi:NAD(P)H-quinone oxidoreductase subunit 5